MKLRIPQRRRGTWPIWTVAGLVLTMATAEVRAERFVVFGPGGLRGADVADDAAVVGRRRTTYNEAARWRAGEAALALGRPAGAAATYAEAVSNDGQAIAGWTYATGGVTQAFRWTAAQGVELLGFLPGQHTSTANAISGDGATVVGTAGTPSEPDREAFRWTRATGVAGLGALPGKTSSTAYAVSRDGRTVVGFSDRGVGEGEAFRWTAAAGMRALGPAMGWDSTVAFGVSGDGAVIVGGLYREGGRSRAFRWTEAGGFQELGTVEGGGSSVATGITDDGTTIVGLGDGGAFVWTAAEGMRPVEAVISGLGPANRIAGWTDLTIAAISGDGRYLLGHGRAPGAREESTWLLDRLR